MKGSLSALLALTAFSSTSLAANGEPPSSPGDDPNANVIPGVFLVEFNDDANTNTARLYRGLSQDLGFDVEPRLDISSKLFKGASFSLKNVSESDVSAVATSILADSRIKQVWPVRRLQFPTLNGTSFGVNATQHRRRVARAEEEDEYVPHVMTQVDKLHADGITGQGLKIGIVDTGIDYTHPALGGCFGPGCLVVSGYDFAGDDQLSPVPLPDADPMDDCNGHGTHVAGIIAAQENEFGFVGAAHGATIGMYKVTSGCSGSTTDEVLLAGFYAAFEDGMDIISCSIGEGSGWASDPLSAAVDRIVEAGVPVALSAGNNPQPWEIVAPASGDKVTGVGSIANLVTPVLETVGSYSINGDDEESFVMAPISSPWKTNVTKPLWAVSFDTEAEHDACSPLPDDTPDLSNVIVLVRAALDLETGCFPGTQAESIRDKGGNQVLFYLESDSAIAQVTQYYLGDTEAAAIKPSQAKVFIDALSDGKNVTVTISNAAQSEIVVENVPNEAAGGYMSPFSTWGPSWELVVKPHISSPGGSILSTWPVAKGSFMVASGTSMAAPLVAGIYALIAEVRGTTDPVLLRNAIASTANQVSWMGPGEPAQPDVIAPAPQQGAGLVQAYDAAHAQAVLSVSSLSFNDSANFASEQSFSIHNSGSENLSFELSHIAAATAETFMDAEGIYMPAPLVTVIDAPATMTFEQTTVSVPAGGSATVKVTLTAPTDINARVVPVYSGFVLLKGTSAGATSLSLPYLGVYGNMRDIPTLNHDLGTASLVDSRGWGVPADQTFVIPRPGQPPIDETAELIFPAAFAQSWTIGIPVLRVDLVPESCSALEGLSCDEEFFGVSTLGPIRPPVHSVRRYGTRLNFNGQLPDGTIVPEGSYRFRIGALRMFGDETKEEDWDLKDTDSFVIEYES